MNIEINGDKALLNGVYYVPTKDIQKYRDIEDKIDELSKNKQEFYKSHSKLPMLRSLFSGALENELETDKEMLFYSIEEMIELIKSFGERKLVNSLVSYNTFNVNIHQYTMWGYEQDLLNEYIVVSDISRKLPYSEVMNKDLAKQRLLTPSEAEYYAENIHENRSKLLLLAAIEGLSVAEIVSVKIADVQAHETHEIIVGDRQIKPSQELYRLLKIVANEKEITIEDKSKVAIYELNDTPYVLRSKKRKDGSPRPLKPYNIHSIIKKKMKAEFDVEYTYTDFRNSSLIWDFLNGFTNEELNKKFNLKFNSEHTVSHKLGERVSLMKEKLSSEKDSE